MSTPMLRSEYVQTACNYQQSPLTINYPPICGLQAALS